MRGIEIEDNAGPSGSSSRHSESGRDIMAGFEDQLLELRMRVCGGGSKRRDIIPIIGMGGSGKTTLARHLYDERLMVEHFDFRGWATVSQEYRAQDVLLQLLSENTEPTEERVELLILRLYQRLKGRRYLIVLDDMWDGEAWDAVRRAFRDDNNGSRVILTSREAGVAEYVDPSASLHQINLLNDDQSWDLLQKKIYGEESSCPSDLEEIGREISGKCKGLPLAIVVIAGVLSTKRTVDYWKYVAENMMSELRNSGDGIFELLSLSYIHLPHYLRPCFLYLGAAFPEDYDIDVSKLIWLWIAEGFIESNVCNKSLEEIAEDYLNDLIKRNLVLLISRGNNDEIGYCGIHDVLREWCIRKAQEERLLILVNDKISEVPKN